MGAMAKTDSSKSLGKMQRMTKGDVMPVETGLPEKIASDRPEIVGSLPVIPAGDDMDFSAWPVAGEFSETGVYRINLDDPSEIVMSPGIERMLGRSCSDLNLNRAGWWRRYIHPDDFGVITSTRDPANWPKGEVRRLFRIRHADGHWVEIYDEGFLTTTPESGTRYLTGCWRDVTTSRRLSRALVTTEALYGNLLMAMSEGVIIFNRFGEIVQTNPAACAMLKVSEEEMRSRTALDPKWHYIGEDGQDLAVEDNPAMEVLRTGRPVQAAVMGFCQKQQAEVIWLNVNAAPLFVEGTDVLSGVIASFADITETIQARKVRERRASLYRQMFEQSTAIQFLVDPVSGRIVDANAAACAFYGYGARALGRMKIGDINMSGDAVIHASMGEIALGNNRRFNFHHRLASGAIRDVEVHASLVTIEGHDYIHSTVFDVTELYSKEAKLSELNRELMLERKRLDEIVTATNVGTWEWKVQTGDVRFNERWANIVGYTLAELAPVDIETWVGLCHPEDFEQSNRLLKRVFARELDYYECECRMRHKDGRWVWVLDRGKVVEWDDQGRPLRMSGTHADIDHTKQMENQIRQLALRDPLTGLSNRYQFETGLKQAVGLSLRLKKCTALLLLDLDHFKEVNDRFGHPVGDQLLIVVADILKRQCRDADIIARLGGDEFAVILPVLSSLEEAQIPARRIIREIGRPKTIEGHDIHVGVSIGISFCPEHATDTENLYRRADQALYEAKHAGRNTCRIYQNAQSDK